MHASRPHILGNNQFGEANFGVFSAHARGGGTTFFAHIGGFLIGLAVATALKRSAQQAPRGNP